MVVSWRSRWGGFMSKPCLPLSFLRQPKTLQRGLARSSVKASNSYQTAHIKKLLNGVLGRVNLVCKIGYPVSCRGRMLKVRREMMTLYTRTQHKAYAEWKITCSRYRVQAIAVIIPRASVTLSLTSRCHEYPAPPTHVCAPAFIS